MMGWDTLLIMAAMMILSTAASVALSSKSGSSSPEAATLSDFDMPQVDEGTPQSVLFGEGDSEDWQVLGYGNFRTSAVKAKQAKK